MFKSNHPKAGGGPKWGLEPKAPASSSKKAPSSPGKGYNDSCKAANSYKAPPTKPAKG